MTVSPTHPPVDNDVQAPLVPPVLAAAIDLPPPPNTNESDGEPQSRSGQIQRSTFSRSLTPTEKGKHGNLGLNTDDTQKKLGKFFKGLGQSKAFPLVMKPKLIPFDQSEP
jgi:hypothetical protein